MRRAWPEFRWRFSSVGDSEGIKRIATFGAENFACLHPGLRLPLQPSPDDAGGIKLDSDGASGTLASDYIADMRILIVEDELDLQRGLARALRDEGYAVDTADNGEDGLFNAESTDYDAIVLDVMMPKLDGWTVLARLRKTKQTPVLMLTARDQSRDRVRGLDTGADDYLVKPFAFEELLARIRVQLRRRQAGQQSDVLRFSALTLDTAARELRVGERRAELTAKEYELLELFMRHPNQVLTREVIYDRVWGYDFGGESNIIEVYVRYLRQKLEVGGTPRVIQTVRGAGYILREE